MAKKIEINQKKLNFYIIIVFLIIIFLIKLDFFKNLYFLVNNNYEKRMIKTYGDCGKDSYGFLKKIKKKYNFKINPKINNSEQIPISNWIIYDPKKEFSKEPKIFLNYNKNPSLKFEEYFKNTDIFLSTDHVQYTDTLKSITFETQNNELNFKTKIKIYNGTDYKKNLIFEEFIDYSFLKNGKIDINLKTNKFNSRWGKYYLEFENILKEEKKKIKSISFEFENEFRFNESQIIFSEGNCYYIK